MPEYGKILLVESAVIDDSIIDRIVKHRAQAVVIFGDADATEAAIRAKGLAIARGESPEASALLGKRTTVALLSIGTSGPDRIAREAYVARAVLARFVVIPLR